jgi:hypothetical protein
LAPYHKNPIRPIGYKRAEDSLSFLIITSTSTFSSHLFICPPLQRQSRPADLCPASHLIKVAEMSDAPLSSRAQEPQPDSLSLDYKISKAIKYLRDDDDKKCLLAMATAAMSDDAETWLSHLSSTQLDTKKLGDKVNEMIQLVEDKSEDKSEAKLFKFFKDDGGLNLVESISLYYEGLASQS